MLNKKKIVVVGSANWDLTLAVDKFPEPGETLLVRSASSTCGGKGANQALAIAGQNASAVFVGCLGRDSAAKKILEVLTSAGVETYGSVQHVGGMKTGNATVVIDRTGENYILVDSGANSSLDSATVSTVLSTYLHEGEVLVCQAEIPRDTLIAAIEYAYEISAVIVLNLAPFAMLPAAVLKKVDYLIVNEIEACQVLDEKFVNWTETKQLAPALASLVARAAIITGGSNGALLCRTSGEVAVVPAEKVAVVDTTGAGDAFVGAFAAALASGVQLQEAVRKGVDLGTEMVQVEGAQHLNVPEKGLGV